MQHLEYAVISAAGLGSRLEMNIPKCLLEVNGRKIIDYQLELLKKVPNIRVVVGFMEEEVIKYIKSVRQDVLFVRNPDFNKTTNAYSLYLGSYDIKKPFLSLDGDLLISRQEFRKFLGICKKDNLVGIGHAKTEDAVFVDFDGQRIKTFSMKKKFDYEWTGLVYLSNIKIQKNKKYVFNVLEDYLPIKAHVIDSFEIDTPSDFKLAQNGFKF